MSRVNQSQVVIPDPVGMLVPAQPPVPFPTRGNDPRRVLIDRRSGRVASLYAADNLPLTPWGRQDVYSKQRRSEQ